MKIIGGDFFCGAGGFTEGAFQAVLGMGGTLTDWLAINHWPRAIETHTANHPAVRHLCARLDAVRPEDAAPRGRMDLLLASPECTHHSVARGGKPMNDQSRAGAWSIIDWVNRMHIETVLIENVREFRKWGPLNKKGQPVKRLAGKTYESFLNALRAAGYTVEDRLLNAADFGDPTTRTRLFIQAQRTRPIVWPTPTRGKEANQVLPQWRAAREIIDWNLKGTSIFTRARPLSDKTLARIEAGLNRFGLASFLVRYQGDHEGRDNSARLAQSIEKPLGAVTTENRFGVAKPFLVKCCNGNSGKKNAANWNCHSVEKPLGGITSTSERALCEPYIVEWDHHGGNGKGVRAASEPMSTMTTKARHGLCEPFLISLRGTSAEQLRMTSQGVDKPVPTISAGGGHSGLCEPYLVQTAHKGKRRGRSVKEPLPTVAGNRGDMALCDPFLTTYYSNGTARSVEEALPTLTTKPRFGLVMPVVEVSGKKYLVDVLFRMLQPHELAGAQGFPKNYKFTGNKSEVVKQIGNAVPVNLAKALVAAALGGAP